MAVGFATPAGGMASSVAELSVDPTRGASGPGWAVETPQDQHLVYHAGEMPEQM